ncbi:hypothetical protein N658DRAFT_493880 [Parathielavia hyrcaniae]|uniref:HAUS augmin-like complex subunit 6 N-terminal domain-containing protein n=1 Tax=Parathielavia hyrcaniae TaxID=113614 RepID=A0AAN6T3F6_9PEZI|nr:hypothetical protein N658DRAFT_493880 [Parathielavia hyrcaniae]
MAHPNAASSLSRARFTRVPANVSKAAQSAPRGNTSSIPSATAVSNSTASPTAPSNVSLFLTNLRLLDLHLRPDWPDISAFTFSTRDAAQGQKKRIQAVEWALYHLFRLWDHDEARNKLQPFFPPLDQVQSLNLRAALLRGLEQAKKNGVLGRDAVVRKTMLDECKGERLEEVLAVFSSAVLKKLVAEQQLNGGGHPSLAEALALEDRGYSGERTELTTLILAHRVSLCRVLDEKKLARARFCAFSDLLASKEKAIVKRREEAEAAKRRGLGQALSDSQKSEVCRVLRINWTGNERWMETLLYGESKSRKDGVLTSPYDRVWRRVQAGRLAELEDTSVGLLEQLGSRVRGQQERLEKWKSFRQRMFGEAGTEPAVKQPVSQSKQKGIDLGFNAHHDLHFGRMSPRKLSRATPRQLDSHYEALIDGLKSDLASISRAALNVPSIFQKRQRAERLPPGDTEVVPETEQISDISDIEEAQPPLRSSRSSPSRREPIRVSEEPAFEPVLRKAKTFDDDHAFFDDIEPFTPSSLQRSATMQSPSPSTRKLPVPRPSRRAPERRSSPVPKPNPRSSPPRPTHSPPRLTAPSPEISSPPEPPLSPTQALADQILASVDAASPSPIKKPRHTLSLAERTRLTMARRTSHANLRVPADVDGLEDEAAEPDADADRLAIERAPVPVPIVTEPPPDQDGADGEADREQHEDLAARTRRSMAGFEAARQRAQVERRRSLRKGKHGGPAPSTPAAGKGSSSFTAVDEQEEEGNTTLLLAEELLSGGQADDYEAVFMSRPKLKTSPIGTPVRELWD